MSYGFIDNTNNRLPTTVNYSEDHYASWHAPPGGSTKNTILNGPSLPETLNP